MSFVPSMRPASEEAVRAAVDFCFEHVADLRLVCIVEDKFTDSTRATGGERVRRNKTVKLALNRAAEGARRRGVLATTTVRVGNPMKELAAEADAVGSSELFFVGTRGPMRAAFTGKPRREAAHVSLKASTVGEFARAA